MKNKIKYLFFVVGLSVCAWICYNLFFKSNLQAKPMSLDYAIGQTNNDLYAISYADTNSAVNKAYIRILDSFYRKQIAAGFNGSVLVGHNGKIIYERYFGKSDITTGSLWNKNTSSQLASTSKPFTATAILFLHQSGYLNIDDPVSKYIKDFPYHDITITMLLNHRSGLPDYTKMSNTYWKTSAPMYNEDLMNYFIKNKPRLVSKPNTRFQYCNTNYAFLATIIERVTKTTFKDFMRDFIFKPLGMNNTYVFDPRDGWHANSSTSYRANFSIFPNTHQDGVYGDKGIYSTLLDMYKWDQSFYNNTILNVKTQQMAYSGYSFESKGTKNYGLGWRMVETDTTKLIYHNGWWHGNNTVFYRFIADNFTIIILGNKYNPKIYQQPKAVYNFYQQVIGKATTKFEFEESGSPQSNTTE